MSDDVVIHTAKLLPAGLHIYDLLTGFVIFLKFVNPTLTRLLWSHLETFNLLRDLITKYFELYLLQTMYHELYKSVD